VTGLTVRPPDTAELIAARQIPSDLPGLSDEVSDYGPTRAHYYSAHVGGPAPRSTVNSLDAPSLVRDERSQESRPSGRAWCLPRPIWPRRPYDVDLHDRTRPLRDL